MCHQWWPTSFRKISISADNPQTRYRTHATTLSCAKIFRRFIFITTRPPITFPITTVEILGQNPRSLKAVGWSNQPNHRRQPLPRRPRWVPIPTPFRPPYLAHSSTSRRSLAAPSRPSQRGGARATRASAKAPCSSPGSPPASPPPPPRRPRRCRLPTPFRPPYLAPAAISRRHLASPSRPSQRGGAHHAWASAEAL